MTLKRENLHAYQVKAVNFVKKKRRCALFLDMGLGKTSTTLTAISDMLEEFSAFRVLIIAPLRVANTVWKQECQKWEHLKHLDIVVATSKPEERIRALNAKHDITVINRENIQWLVDHNKKWPFDMVIIDESSGFKSSASKRFKALKKVLPSTYSMVLLTGTPSPQGLLDLWSQMYLIDFGQRLGRTKTAFLSRYFSACGYMGREYRLNVGCEEQIREKIQDSCLTMVSEDYLDLPERIDIFEYIEMPSTAVKQYKELKKEMMLTLNGEGNADTDIMTPSASGLSNKLLQMCNGAIYDEQGTWHHIHDEKIKALREIMEDNPNENVLVAYNYKSDKERLLKAFPYAKELDKAGELVDEWNKGKIRMLIAHPASAGHGLNMQFGGSTLIYFGLTWSLELYLQFNKRLHRQGQQNSVKIVHLVTKGCIDEVVMKAIARKNATQTSLIKALIAYFKEE